MKRHVALLLFLALGACPSLLANPGETGEPKGNLYTTIEVVDGLELEAVDKSITRAALGRRWKITSKEEGLIEINLVHRGYDSTLTFAFDTDEIRIYSNSYAVKKNGERKKSKDPEGWIANLEKDIKVFMNEEAFL